MGVDEEKQELIALIQQKPIEVIKKVLEEYNMRSLVELENRTIEEIKEFLNRVVEEELNISLTQAM